MLTVTAGSTRRDFLTIGGLGLGGLLMSPLFERIAAAAPASAPVTTGKSVIFLFLQGGPSQHETFDPKLDVPEAVRTATGAIDTSLPGVVFGSRLPQLASRA